MAAEYIMAGGNENVIMCERGIRTFETYTRNTLDLSVIPIIKSKTHLPIIIDPSHATGDRKLVESMSLAAIAAGADGLIIEVHDNPECAWSDGAQSVTPDAFKTLIEKGKKIAKRNWQGYVIPYSKKLISPKRNELFDSNGSEQFMKVKVYPSVCTGEIQIPPSKSMAHRAIMCASLAKRKKCYFKYCVF